MWSSRHLMGIVGAFVSSTLSVGVLLAGLLLLSGNALAQDALPSWLGDYGNVTVMAIEGNYDVVLPDGTINTAPREAIASEFYRSHSDDYDFLIIFSNFDIGTPEAQALGYYTSVRNDIHGIGLDQFDYSSLYGSASRLQGTIDMGNLAQHSADPLSADFEKTLYTLNHEILHRWSGKVSFLDEAGQASSALLGLNASHWSYLLDSDASLLYGSNWHNNGDGTFTALEVANSFSPLDLYLMGMIGKQEVPPMTLIENPDIDARQLPQAGVTIAGSSSTVTIEDIIAAEGPRIPAVEDAQKSFKAAFILVVEPGTFSGQELFAIERIRNGFLTRYSILTDGQGLMQVSSKLLTDLPTNPGVSLATLVPRTLPANIEEGLSWLISQQNADGSWDDSLQTQSRDTSEATLALQQFSARPEDINAGADWLMAASSQNTDYLSRRIAAIVTTGRDASELIAILLNWQNSDGGWGSSQGFASNSIDTSLALKALGRAGYTNRVVLDKAINYLVDQQLVGGGWGLDGLQGLVQTTASALQALKSHAVSSDLDSAINAGVAFLYSKQNADSGFGDSSSTIYDSAATLLALSEVGVDLGTGRQVANFLENYQFPDGSWYDSPYQTAMALQALWRSSRDPDLAVSNADISLIPEQISTLPCETVVSVEVANLGRTDVPQAVVHLYEGAVDAQHLLAEQSAAFPGLGKTTLTFPLELVEGRTYSLIVVVDPDGEITELDKGNNRAGRTLMAEATHDFAITERSLSLSRSEVAQGSELTINALISNSGTSDAYNVPLRFYLDDRGQQIEIATPTVDLPAGQVTPVVINWYATYPGESLQVVASVDPDNQFAELDENNNQASVALKVVTSQLPNLVLTAEPQFTPQAALQGGEVLIAVTMLNSGSVAANNIAVSFYQGSPEAGGTLLGEVVVAQIDAAESLPVGFLWQAINDSGEQLIVVRADAAETITEVDESDNQTLARLSVLSLPDLAITAADITMEPSAPRADEAVTVAVNLYNQGDQDASEIRVDLDVAGEIFTQVVPLVAGKSWSGLAFDLGSGLPAGDHLLRLVVDPDNQQVESDEDNNHVEISIGSQNADLWVSEVYFSPNGDQVKDSTRIFYRFTLPQTLSVEVQSVDGEIVRHLSDGFESDVVDGNKLWDGRNDRGGLVADGAYQLRVVSAAGLLLGSLQVVVDTNRSSLFDALGSDFLLDAALACDLPKWVQWEWLPAENRLLFGIVNSSLSDYETGIYAKDIATGEVTRLLPDDWIAANPLTSYSAFEYFLSPDKSWLALTFNKLDTQTQIETSELWLVDSDGSNLRQLQSYQRGYAVYDIWWSPNGAALLVEAGNSKEVFDLVTATNHSLDNSTDNLIWAPDSSRFLVEGDSLSLVEFDGSRRTLFDGWADGYWLNNHKIVAVEWGRYEREQYIWLIDVDGGQPPLLLTDDYSHSLTFAADGESFAFVEGHYSADKLKRVILVDSSGQQTILHQTPYLTRDKQFSSYDTTYGAGIISNLLWSPDSQKLAFVDRLAQPIATSTYVPELMVYTLEDAAFTSFPLFACSSFYDSSCQNDNSCWNGCVDIEPQVEMGRVRSLRYWSEDNQTIVVKGDDWFYLFDLNSGEKRQLPFSNYTKGLEFSFYLDEILYQGQACGPGESGLWRFASLLNLTADLRPIRERSAIALYGTAADLNFSNYRLEYADLQQADNWLPIQPAMTAAAVDEYLTLWVPPQPGNYLLRLTVEDKAGNRRISRKQVAWSKASLLHNLYRSDDIFSPNGDGVKDSMSLSFTVAGPVQFSAEVINADGASVRSFARSYSQATSGEIVWDGRNDAGQIVADGDYTLRLLDFVFAVEVDATLPAVELTLAPDNGLDIELRGQALDLNLTTMRIERKPLDDNDGWAEYPRPSCAIDASESVVDADEAVVDGAEKSLCQIQQLHGAEIGEALRFQDYRLVAEDRAGNRSIVVAPRVKPDFILYAWGLPIPLEIANRGSALPEFPHGDIPFVRRGEGLIRQAIGYTTLNEPWLEVAMQYWLDGSWHDTLAVPETSLPDSMVTLDAPQYGRFSFFWDATPVLDGKPFKLRLKAVNAAGELRFSNELTTRNLLGITPDCQGYRGTASLFENLQVLRHQVVSESTLASIIVRANSDWSLTEMIRKTGNDFQDLLDLIPEEAWQDYETIYAADEIPGNFFDRGFGPERYPTDYSLPLPENSGEQYLLRLTAVGESGEPYLSAVTAYYPRECPLELSLQQVAEETCSVDVPQYVDLYIDQVPATAGFVFNTIEFLLDEGEDELLLESWQAPFPVTLQPDFNPPRNVWGLTRLQLATLPAGANRIIARLHYLDLSDGQLKSVDDELNIFVADRSAPSPQVTIEYPHDGSSLGCRDWQQADGSWTPLVIGGEVVSDQPLASFKVCYYGRDSDDLSASLWEWQKAPHSLASQAPDLAGLFAYQGQFSSLTTEILNINSAQRLRLIVYDENGQSGFDEITLQANNTILLAQVDSTLELFSPNGDLRKDEISINYHLGEDAQVTIHISGEGTDFDLLRDVLQLEGDHSYIWSGIAPGLGIVADGVYEISVKAVDSCGKQSLETFRVTVDTLAPVLEIVNPAADSSLPVGKLVEVSASSDEQATSTFKLEAGAGSQATQWQTVTQGTRWPLNNRLGRWQTEDTPGPWTLRLTAEDEAGNRGMSMVQVDMLARPILFGAMTLQPDYLSPDGDGQQNSLSLSYELFETSLPTFEILHADGEVVYRDSRSQAVTGLQSWNWDGRNSAGVAVADGSYRVRLTAAMATETSLTQVEELTLIVDTTPPTFVINSPAFNAYPGEAPPALSGVISDSNLHSYQLQLSNASGLLLTDSGSSADTSYELLLSDVLTEGQYTINGFATDLAGNRKELSQVFTLDMTPPQVELLSPVAGAAFSGDSAVVTIAARVAENNLSSYQLRFGRGAEPSLWTTLASGSELSNGEIEFDWSVGVASGLDDGIYTLSLHAVDLAGHEGEARSQVLIDNSAPLAAIDVPAEGASIVAPFAITGSAVDGNFASALLEWSPGRCAVAYRWATFVRLADAVANGLIAEVPILPEDGDYCLRLGVTDLADNHSEFLRNLTIDTTPPDKPVLSGEVASARDVNLVWPTVAAVDLASYQLYRNGRKISQLGGDATSFTELNLDEGEYQYQLQALDQAGNLSTISDPFVALIDRTAPLAVLSHPVDSSRQSGMVEIRGTAFSQNDFLEYRLYYAMGEAPLAWTLLQRSSLAESAHRLAQWDSWGLPDGLYSLRLEVEDVSGNQAAYTLKVLLDNSPPQAPVLHAAQELQGKVNLSWDANQESDLSGYLLFRNGRLVNAVGVVIGSLLPYQLDALEYNDQVVDGTHSYTLVAVDQAGNLSAPSVERVVTVDTRAPHALILQPSNGTEFDETLQIIVESADEDIAGIVFEYSLTGNSDWFELARVETQPYLTTIDPASFAWDYGTIFLRAVATDQAGQSDPQPQIIQVEYRDLAAPVAPQNLLATYSCATFTLNWADNQENDLAAYRIYRVDSIAPVLLASLQAPVNQWSMTDVPESGYVVAMTAVDSTTSESQLSVEVVVGLATPRWVSGHMDTTELQLDLTAEVLATAQTTLTLWRDQSVVDQVTAADGRFTFSDVALALGENIFRLQASDQHGNSSCVSGELIITRSEVVPDDLSPLPPALFYPTVTGLDKTVFEDSVKIKGMTEAQARVQLFTDGLPVATTVALATPQVKSVSYAFSGYNASLSANGRYLAYVNDESGDSSLIFRELASGNETVVATDVYEYLWTGHDRQLIYSYADQNYDDQIAVFSLETGKSQAVTADDGAYNDDPSASRNGNLLAYVSSRDGDYDVWIEDFSTGTLTRITDGLDVDTVAVSADGSRVAYYDDDDEILYVTELASGQTFEVDFDPSWQGFEWSADSRYLAYLAYTNGNKDIYVYDAVNQTSVQLTDNQLLEYKLHWSPGGSTIIYQQRQADGNEALLQVNLAGDSQPLVADLIDVSTLQWQPTGEIVYVDDDASLINYLLPPGLFSFDEVTLSPGENQFYAKASDRAGNSSATSEAITIIYDTSRLPDVAVAAADIFIAPQLPAPGELVVGNALLRNPTATDLAQLQVDIYLWVEQNKLVFLQSQTIDSLAAGASTRLNFSFIAPDVSGSSSLLIMADPQEQIAELVESNNFASRDFHVSSEAGVQLSLLLNGTSFSSQQELEVSLELLNNGRVFDGRLEVQVEDQSGNTVAVLAQLDSQFAFGTESFAYRWQSGDIFAGDYQLYCAIYDNSDTLLAAVRRNFTIIPDSSVALSVITDRYSYLANQPVLVEIELHNNAANQILSALLLTTRIIDSNGQQLFFDSQTLAQLMPDMSGRFIANWNSAQTAAGDFTVVSDVLEDGVVLQSATTDFSIIAESRVVASLEVEPQTLIYGFDLKLPYTIANQGNHAATGKLRVVLIDPVSLSIIATAEEDLDIAVHGSATGEFVFPTMAAELRTYRARLYFDSGDQQQLLSEQQFQVIDGVAPELAIKSPLLDEIYHQEVSFEVVASDDVSGVEVVSYRLDGGDWTALPFVDRDAGRFAMTWNPVTAENGMHSVEFLVIDQAGNRSQSAARYFEVQMNVTPPIPLPEVEVESSILNLPRVLVWIGDKRETEGGNNDRGCGRRKNSRTNETANTRQDLIDFVVASFAGQDAYYQIADNQDEYLRAFRSGIFNLTMILDTKLPGGGSFVPEFTEAIRRGMGLFYAPGKHDGDPELQALLGVKYKGKLSRRHSQLSLQLYDSPVAASGEVGLLGTILKTELAGGELAAVIPTMSRRQPLRSMTLRLPLDCQPGDQIKISLLRRHEGQRQIIDEEWLSVNGQDMSDVNQSLGNIYGDLSLRGNRENVELNIAFRFGVMQDNYELDVVLQSGQDGSARPLITSLKLAHDTRWSVGAMLGYCQVTALNGRQSMLYSDIPGIVLHQYGAGRSVFLAFDLLASAAVEDRSVYLRLVQNALAFLLPESTAPAVATTELLQTMVEWSANGLDLLAIEHLLPGLSYQPLFNHNRETLAYNLAGEGWNQASYRYFVQTEDRAGTYDKETEVQLVVDSIPMTHAVYPYAFMVEKSSAQRLQDVMAWVDEMLLLPPSGGTGYDQGRSNHHGGGRRYHGGRHDNNYSSHSLRSLKEQLLQIDLMDKSSAELLERVIEKSLHALSRLDKLPLDIEAPRSWLNDYLRIMAVKYAAFSP